jgi:galactofuranosylgalactofuranosylrhamnosyl-N-acetylglucosaminyl-diphospho-decaprenol beta-1,5/1,6-galactofuranosyltransferase
MVHQLSEEISEASFANQISEILIVDHGNQSILDTMTNKKKVRIIRQPNTGAAGGFGRLMFESLHSQGDGTFLFDEDIDVEMFVIKRMLAFAAVSKNLTVIGTQTLNLFKRDHYWMEYEVIDVRRGAAKALPFSLNRQNVQIPQRYFERINSIPWTCA